MHKIQCVYAQDAWPRTGMSRHDVRNGVKCSRADMTGNFTRSKSKGDNYGKHAR
jgi:hypothetical protein